MQPDENGPTLCGVCGHPILALAGLADLSCLGLPPQPCCGECGPIVDRLAAGEPPTILPDGPLRTVVATLAARDFAAQTMGALDWLRAQDRGTLLFAGLGASVVASCTGPDGAPVNVAADHVLGAIRGLRERVEPAPETPVAH